MSTSWMLAILFGTALVCCSMGFRQFVWFMSIGYGFAIAGVSAVLFILALIQNSLTVPLALALCVSFTYGMRLGLFLYARQKNSKNYQKVIAEKTGSEPPVFVKVIMWLAMGVIYLCEMAGLVCRVLNRSADNAWLYAGIVVMILGAVVEAMADKQKSDQKKANPSLPAMQGLFEFVRCPNYFGEMTFWTGVFFCGIGAYQTWWQWLAAVFGWVCIVYIMIDGARRLEIGHEAHYGQLESYRAYADKTPLLFPFVPLYHLSQTPASKNKSAGKSAR